MLASVFTSPSGIRRNTFDMLKVTRFLLSVVAQVITELVHMNKFDDLEEIMSLGAYRKGNSKLRKIFSLLH
jgi:hypothetical protein